MKILLELIFATNNQHKLREVSSILGDDIKLMPLAELGIHADIPEEGETLEENARQKAWFIYRQTGINCFADDTGLEVEALDGRPGVYSARYAGKSCSYEDNVRKLLKEMKGISNRRARFRTVIALILDGKEYLFEGRVNGFLLEEEKGKGGFGYDPIFVPEGYSETFAQMPEQVKNSISHRGEVVRKMADFLRVYLQFHSLG